MLPTTHIAASCLLTSYTINSGMGPVPQAAVLSGGSLLLHYALDTIPHGYIATPDTIFKKVLPTLIETVPGPLIFIASALLFGHPFLFALAAFFGLLPDLIAMLYHSRRGLADKIPLAAFLHRVHRKVHWFETDHADGSFTFLFPKNPLLVGEALLLFCIVTVLFV